MRRIDARTAVSTAEGFAAGLVTHTAGHGWDSVRQPPRRGIDGARVGLAGTAAAERPRREPA